MWTDTWWFISKFTLDNFGVNLHSRTGEVYWISGRRSVIDDHRVFYVAFSMSACVLRFFALTGAVYNCAYDIYLHVTFSIKIKIIISLYLEFTPNTTVFVVYNC